MADRPQYKQLEWGYPSISLSDEEVTLTGANLRVGHFFFLSRSMYVKSATIKAANIITSEKEKFIRFTSLPEETAPTQGMLYKPNYTTSLRSPQALLFCSRGGDLYGNGNTDRCFIRFSTPSRRSIDVISLVINSHPGQQLSILRAIDQHVGDAMAALEKAQQPAQENKEADNAE
ncbi:hypothetical protein ACE3MQ_06360 [Paenibacillus lentus]|uniref:hypothetical protein n=1 Tax=Paenibacillus lentus TaxID=1338368 RepID=UPI003660A07C